jgi:hypothetical protein
MDVNPLFVNLEPSEYLDLARSSEISLENMPLAWNAVESAIAPDLASRQSGLERLIELNIASFSPLIAYFLATRILEPDIELRTRIVETLAGILKTGENDQPSKKAVILYLNNVLAQMRTRQIFALLQVAEYTHSAEAHVAVLINGCSYAGVHLSDILIDWEMPVGIRKQAVKFISQVGFLDAIPALERVAGRLSTKYPPQHRLPGMPPEIEDEEASLLPLIKDAIATLKAP